MNRILFLALFATAAVAGTISARLGQVDPPVNLQAATPGVQQVGNTNVSGKMIAGSLSASNSSPTAQVIVGNATSTTGANYAGLFRTDSVAGTGIRGVASATTGAGNGGTFQSAGPNGAGVRGYSTAASGVNYGVYGKATSPAGFGVFSAGNMSASGVISGNGSGLTGVNADLIDGLNSTAFLQSVPNPLTLSGTSAGSHIVRGENGSATAYSSGVYGLSTASNGFTFGGRFENSSEDGPGVYGLSAASNGYTHGGRFENSSTNGRGVFGNAYANTGATYGGYFQSLSTSGTGVYGIAATFSAAGNPYGGNFESNGPNGRGVRGAAYATTGLAIGGRFSSASDGGRGVWSTASATTGTNYGVFGETPSSDGRGVFGYATATVGGYGVYGQASLMGYAVFANGNMAATGTKPFRIDHPDDPSNKYLLHYSTESPEVLNAYSGKIVLDGAGGAVVELPHYFAKINRDPRYTLTAVGAPMPNLHVAEEIDEAALSAGARAEPGDPSPRCSFRIAGGKPGKKVSWRVEAVRNDRWVQKRGAPVEVEKEGLEKGTDQHPELYGLGPERGMNYDPARQKVRTRR